MAIQTGIEAPATTPRTGAPSVLAIVVTHGGEEWLRRCLVTLAAQQYPSFSVLVVDDASPQVPGQGPTRRIVKRHVKQLQWGYMRTPRPLGYGGAINWALSRVRTKADLLLFLHDDVWVGEDALTEMVRRILEDPGAAFVGPKIVSYEDPLRLEEVGMHADRFGYPYRGLEEGEIDLGQHDSRREVFYVTSTCMLVWHKVFKELRGWDARLRAFAEDLDICWRARLAGYNVLVAPKARIGHAMGLATGQRASPFKPARYYSRRNRLRTVFKNASGLRLIPLIPQFILLTFAEMVAFIVLRQPQEISNLWRALGWNFARLFQTLSERAKVQRGRRVSDLKLRRHTIRQRTRARVYLIHQRTRFEEAWGRRGEIAASRGERARALGLSLKGWLGFAVLLGLLSLFFGFRHVWWRPPMSLGEMLPFPEGPFEMWKAYLAPWRPAGLGDPGVGPPALAMLGAVSPLALGSAGAAQKLLVLLLGLTAFWGAYLLVGDFADRKARFAAGIAYMLGGVGYAGLQEGALGALILGAAAPYVLRGLIRLTGWTRPPDWHSGRAVARVALATGISGAFVPGSVLLYVLVAGILLLLRWALVGHRPEGGVKVLVALAAGWALLLPWSATWLSSDGGPLYLQWSTETWRLYAGNFADHDILTVLLGQTPDAPLFFGLALPVFGVVALIAGAGQRRRIALGLWAVIVVVGWLVGATAAGWIRPLVASPTEAGVFVSLAFASLVGLAVAGLRLDLPRRGFGGVRWVALLLMAGATIAAGAGLVPSLYHGEWRPEGAPERAAAVEQIQELFEIEAEASGPFRVLWVGEGWTGRASSARPPGRSFVTDSRGPQLTDLFEDPLGQADRELRKVVASIDSGATDRGGALLGAFNIRYVTLDRGDSRNWLVQRDLALVRTEADYFLFENRQYLPRAAVFDRLPSYVTLLEEEDPRFVRPRELREALLDRTDISRFRAEESDPGTLFLAESTDREWAAQQDGRRLARAEGGWGNAFFVPQEGGPVTVAYPRTPPQILWLFVVALAWIVVIGASFSRRPERGRGR